jgi:hypothetical protein
MSLRSQTRRQTRMSAPPKLWGASRLLGGVAAGVLAGLPSLAWAGSFAAGVVSYTPGGSDPNFQTPAAALGAPDGISGENAAATNYFGFPNVLSPFSPAYQGDEVVQIGEGGQLTLRLANFVNVGAGKRLGVISNVGLQDSPSFNGQNLSPAATFGGGVARVKVSQDNVNWVDLGNVTFNVPSLYYVNAGPYDASAPASPQLTDFGKPFEGTLASFDGKDFAGTVDAFKVAAGGYSGGGTWLDLSSSGLAQVGYVQFLVPDDGDPLTVNRFAIDSVSIANGAVGAATPEPGSLALIGLSVLVLRRKGR